MKGYQADINYFDQPLEIFESSFPNYNEEDVEDFEPEIKNLYKESNIIDPKEIINRVMNILIEEQYQIKEIIEEFQEKSVIARIKK